MFLRAVFHLGPCGDAADLSAMLKGLRSRKVIGDWREAAECARHRPNARAVEFRSLFDMACAMRAWAAV